MPTRLDLKERLRAYLATYPNVGTDVTDGNPPQKFPAFEVEFYGVTSVRSGGRNVNTYPVRVYVYVRKASDQTRDKLIRADREAAEVLIDPFAEFLADNPTLKLIQNGTTNVKLASGELVVSSEGVGILTLNDIDYAGFTLEFQLTK